MINQIGLKSKPRMGCIVEKSRPVCYNNLVYTCFLAGMMQWGGVSMKVLGIDPGYAIVGYGVVQGDAGSIRVDDFGAIITQAHTTFEDRLAEIYGDLRELLEAHRPEVMAIESLFYTTNQKTVIAVAEARGVILLAARQAQIPIFEYTPLQIKQSVAGYGKATKRQMQEMTQRLLRLKEIPKPDDAADALAVGICHIHSARSLQFGKKRTKREEMGYY